MQVYNKRYRVGLPDLLINLFKGLDLNPVRNEAHERDSVKIDHTRDSNLVLVDDRRLRVMYAADGRYRLRLELTRD